MWRTLGVNIRILFSAQHIQDTQNYHGHACNQEGKQQECGYIHAENLATMRCLRLNQRLYIEGLETSPINTR